MNTEVEMSKTPKSEERTEVVLSQHVGVRVIYSAFQDYDLRVERVFAACNSRQESSDTYLRDETPFTLAAGREKQQGGPSSRK